MNITILFFGRIREIIKSDSINLQIPDNSTLKTLIIMMENACYILSELSITYSINNENIENIGSKESRGSKDLLDISLHDGDIIGFISKENTKENTKIQAANLSNISN